MKKIKILLVEDYYSVKKLLKEFLELENYEVIDDDGSKAFELMRDYNFDLIITDWYLKKEKTGIDIIKFARSKFGKIKIIFMTAETDEIEIISMAKNAGADFVIFKPFSLKILKQSIQMLFENPDA